jgi:hypothetical protein
MHTGCGIDKIVWRISKIRFQIESHAFLAVPISSSLQFRSLGLIYTSVSA